ncbi:uncharacterized protein LOC143287902 [Babylonia areolata]|uniref:uncharacterized protein LOC143287902 n=1 Tax=Babylonia areolata TaxID=304850 RepID=UPI003FD0B07E
MVPTSAVSDMNNYHSMNNYNAGASTFYDSMNECYFVVAVLLWKFCPPVVLILGTFGNIMSIFIMGRTSSGESTVNIFFLAIAVGDLVTLYTGITLKWLEVSFGLIFPSGWPLLMWITPASGAIVSWMLVCVTLQRVLSVVWPHHVHRIYTRKRVFLLIGGVTAFLAALYSHSLYCFYPVSQRNDSSYNCISSSPQYAWFIDKVFSYVDLVVFSVVPFVCLAVGNSVLIWKLTASARAAGRSMATASSQHMVKRNQNNTSVTLTVLVVSMTFLVLTLPSALFYVLFFAKDQTALAPRKAADVYLFSTLGILLADSNSAVNFYLYCLTGRRFREEFMKIVCWWKTTTPRGNS